VISPEDGPVDPKHIEIRRYMNKIEIVTSVGFYFIHTIKYMKLNLYCSTRSCFSSVKSYYNNLSIRY
jgi:hypothetical protein